MLGWDELYRRYCPEISPVGVIGFNPGEQGLACGWHGERLLRNSFILYPSKFVASQSIKASLRNCINRIAR